eukprot:CAMPEP_0194335804 /NCGR_PEP_ID=MMETSP0171-20130528/70802_1 /TAXON_ID=218684 /ORGANISM="Corethron pennatum, Strain L29A3" /LENGTH=93 /DNA_ID=CAMNT_0039099025 /DNA_START=40 /DNA_END=318 /DNA_ORIENTATION=-
MKKHMFTGSTRLDWGAPVGWEGAATPLRPAATTPAAKTTPLRPAATAGVAGTGERRRSAAGTSTQARSWTVLVPYPSRPAAAGAGASRAAREG